MLATVQDASRRLGRCRKRHPGRRLLAWRSADRQVGTKGCRLWSNKGMGFRRPPVVGSGSSRIERCLALQQRAEEIEQAIAEAASGRGTGRPFGITTFADRVMLHGDAGPLIEDVAQPVVAGVSPQHDAGLSAAARPPEPAPTRHARRGNLVAAEARRPRRAARR